MNKEKYVIVSEGSVGFWSLLGLLFITLKLVGVIDWSWIWVLAPFWVPITVIILFIGIIISLAVLSYIIWASGSYIQSFMRFITKQRR